MGKIFDTKMIEWCPFITNMLLLHHEADKNDVDKLDPNASKIIKKFQLLLQTSFYYCISLHHEADKNEADKLDPNG